MIDIDVAIAEVGMVLDKTFVPDDNAEDTFGDALRRTWLELRRRLAATVEDAKQAIADEQAAASVDFGRMHARQQRMAQEMMGLQARAERAEAATRWTPCSEAMPTDGQWVELVTCDDITGGHHLKVRRWDAAENGWYGGQDGDEPVYYEATWASHWRPWSGWPGEEGKK